MAGGTGTNKNGDGDGSCPHSVSILVDPNLFHSSTGGAAPPKRASNSEVLRWLYQGKGLVQACTS